MSCIACSGKAALLNRPDFFKLILNVCKQKLGSSATQTDLCLEKKDKRGNTRFPRKDNRKREGKERRDKKVERGRTIPSCKSNYAFYDFNESQMSTNKRSSKTEMQTEKRERDVTSEEKGKKQRIPQGGEVYKLVLSSALSSPADALLW